MTDQPVHRCEVCGSPVVVVGGEPGPGGTRRYLRVEDAETPFCATCGWTLSRRGECYACLVGDLRNERDDLTAALAAEREHSRRLVNRWRGRVERAEQQYQALEAERDAERARADDAEACYAAAINAANLAANERDALRAEVARLRAAAQAVAEWMVSEDGPLYQEWENGDLGGWDDDDWDWDQTLDAIRTTTTDVWTGFGGDSGGVAVYRRLSAALAQTPPEEGSDV